jgi:phosphinothricin acetyltransferase
MNIRDGRPDDLEQLNDLYNYYVVNEPCTFDIERVSIETRRAWFGEFGGGRYRLLVAVEGDTLLGYAHSKSFRLRRAYETSVSTSVYIDKHHHGRGIGRALYSALFDAIADEDIHRAFAGITMPNIASVALHESFGFKQVALFSEQGRKFDRYWDVAWFEKEL